MRYDPSIDVNRARSFRVPSTAIFVTEAVREGVRLRLAAGAATAWAIVNVPESDRRRFAEIAETELMGLHEGNFARFRLRPSEFDAWQLLQDDDRSERTDGAR